MTPLDLTSFEASEHYQHTWFRGKLEMENTFGEMQVLKDGDLERAVLSESEGAINHLLAIWCHDVLIWS